MKSPIDKVNEALSLLNDAFKDEKDELYDLISEKYTNIKDAFNEKMDEGKGAVKQFKKDAMKAVKSGEEIVADKAKEIDDKVRNNPWPFVGGVACSFLLLGYILGGKK